MSRMIDLIRQSAVPATLMRTAAKGALSLPATEMLEILVVLANHVLFGEQARLTLAGWDEASTLGVISDPQAPADVLDYFSSPANLRPRLVPALLENPGVPAARLLELATSTSRGLLTMMVASARVRSQPEVVQALLDNPKLSENERAQLHDTTGQQCTPAKDVTGEGVLDPELTQYLSEHATEIAAEEGKPFHLTDATTEEQAEMSAASPDPAHTGVSLMGAAAFAMKLAESRQEKERLTPVQRIARMTVFERVQLALKGKREDRFILIRDGAKIVSRAVLEAPKLTDTEVESFAAMKNVGEHVLRIIASKRRFMRNYTMRRILTTNPKCPLDVSLPLTKELLVADLNHLLRNKNVSDTLRKFAYKCWKQKTQNIAME
jgi:hypothetical protein